MKDNSKYGLRGVSSDKKEVHEAIRNLDKGLFPNAFCKILPDIVGKDSDYCNIMHADTAGTKTSLAYLYWKETGNDAVWKGIAQDAIVMNLDDMACCGCVSDIVISSTIGRNKHLIPGSVIQHLIEGTHAFLEDLKPYGIDIQLAGGETADVGDIVRTIDVGITAFGRMKRKEVIVNNIQHGDVVVGLASFGQTVYEKDYNSGIGSNGLTSARHDVLRAEYGHKYPESVDPNTPNEVTYIGNRSLVDELELQGETYQVGSLLLTPTRTYLPFIKQLLQSVEPGDIHGMIHCTGGGQTKVLKFIQDKKVVKNILFPIPPVFELIQSETNTDWEEMYKVFNMGHRLEVYLPEKLASELIPLAASFGIAAQVIGHVEGSKQNEVFLESPYGTFSYQ